MPLLWMRFTLAGRRSNISVGKPIYILRVCSTRVKAHANNRDWPVRGKYLFWLLIGDTQGLGRRLLKDPLLKDIRGPFPREFAPVLISSYCIYTALLAIYASSVSHMDAHFTIVPIHLPGRIGGLRWRRRTTVKRFRIGKFTRNIITPSFLEIINVEFFEGTLPWWVFTPVLCLWKEYRLCQTYTFCVYVSGIWPMDKNCPVLVREFGINKTSCEFFVIRIRIWILFCF